MKDLMLSSMINVIVTVSTKNSHTVPSLWPEQMNELNDFLRSRRFMSYQTLSQTKKT